MVDIAHNISEYARRLLERQVAVHIVATDRDTEVMVFSDTHDEETCRQEARRALTRLEERDPDE